MNSTFNVYNNYNITICLNIGIKGMIYLVYIITEGQLLYCTFFNTRKIFFLEKDTTRDVNSKNFFLTCYNI